MHIHDLECLLGMEKITGGSAYLIWKTDGLTAILDITSHSLAASIMQIAPDSNKAIDYQCKHAIVTDGFLDFTDEDGPDFLKNQFAPLVLHGAIQPMIAA